MIILGLSCGQEETGYCLWGDDGWMFSAAHKPVPVNTLSNFDDWLRREITLNDPPDKPLDWLHPKTVNIVAARGDRGKVDTIKSACVATGRNEPFLVGAWELLHFVAEGGEAEPFMVKKAAKLKTCGEIACEDEAYAIHVAHWGYWEMCKYW